MRALPVSQRRDANITAVYVELNFVAGLSMEFRDVQCGQRRLIAAWSYRVWVYLLWMSCWYILLGTDELPDVFTFIMPLILKLLRLLWRRNGRLSLMSWSWFLAIITLTEFSCSHRNVEITLVICMKIYLVVVAVSHGGRVVILITFDRDTNKRNNKQRVSYWYVRWTVGTKYEAGWLNTVFFPRKMWPAYFSRAARLYHVWLHLICWC